MEFFKYDGVSYTSWLYKVFDDNGQPRANYHRDDGPAIEFTNGGISWYLWGEQYEFKNWLRKTPISIEEKALLKLRYG